MLLWREHRDTERSEKRVAPGARKYPHAAFHIPSGMIRGSAGDLGYLRLRKGSQGEMVWLFMVFLKYVGGICSMFAEVEGMLGISWSPGFMTELTRWTRACISVPVWKENKDIYKDHTDLKCDRTTPKPSRFANQNNSQTTLRTKGGAKHNQPKCEDAQRREDVGVSLRR